MRPYDTKTEEDILTLVEDNFPRGSSKVSILVQEDHVSIHDSNGAGYITIKKHEFNKIIDWYLKDQPVRNEKERDDE